MASPSNSSDADFSSLNPPAADAAINNADGKKYWEGINADVDGMLGGFAHITKVDLQGSRNFLAKFGIGTRNGLRVVPSALEGGAGIGRVTEGLLLDVAENVDIVEPIAKFTAALQGKKGVRQIFNLGLEEWQPAEGAAYDLIWNQWCVGHLTDEQLVAYLGRCKSVLNPGGVIVIKENNSTTGDDIFDPEDSSVTRGDNKFRALFKQAGLRLVKAEIQRGLQTPGGVKLFTVRMYALKPVDA
ncbi:S-adenosylmethionine-dependent methyltransferase-like protein [Cercophora scortea]|uniref:Alpha N-terminal protein methyltransferase 1 n=1 Tax=Cercophora scortea TaxID=314031 RepID=A0AAE0INF2_9PEZI|nr:S-adenosylmethionine-dependent methyltransferase-like protein [Cercophora scortea]